MSCPCGSKGKYKCPKCLESYCSSSCCKIHKEVCEARKKNMQEPGPAVRHPPRNFLMEEEDETVLSEEDLQLMSNNQLGNNESLLALLKIPGIRKILEEIDKSENRLGALRSVITQDKEGKSPMGQCFDEMLKSIGCLDADGVSQL